MAYFSCRFSPAEETQLIISVSKKVSKKAVTRNTIKRRIRAAFRHFSNKLKVGKYLIIAKPGVEAVRGQELENELRSVIMM